MLHVGDCRVLFWDIETAPILGEVWAAWEQNVGLSQMVKDWHFLSVAAKWLDEKTVSKDQSKVKRVEDDRKLVKWARDLLDEADVVVSYNGKRFDSRKFAARCVMLNLTPPSPYREIDLMLIVKKHFAFPYYSLEYVASRLCGMKKLKHKKYPGHKLWRACLEKDPAAFAEMSRYNERDVDILPKLMERLLPWEPFFFGVYTQSPTDYCFCGGKLAKRGYTFTTVGKYQRFQCKEKKCGAWSRGSENLLERTKRRLMRRKIPR